MERKIGILFNLTRGCGIYGNRDKIKGTITYLLQAYGQNLEELERILKANTPAKLIFVTTTYVPVNESDRFFEDVPKYNEIAKTVMKKNGVIVNDIYQKYIAIHLKNGLRDNDVHYNKDGYKELNELIAPMLNKALEKL